MNHELVRLRSRFIKSGAITLTLLVCFFTLSNTLAADKNESKDTPPTPVEAEVVIKVTTEDMPIKDIYRGYFTETIKNPRCVNFGILMRNTPQYKEIEKNKMQPGEGKYWIRLSMASEITHKQIDILAKSLGFSFVCERKTLFDILRKQKEFEKKTDSQLIEQFDFTQQVLDLAKEQNKKKKNDNQYLLK